LLASSSGFLRLGSMVCRKRERPHGGGCSRRGEERRRGLAGERRGVGLGGGQERRRGSASERSSGGGARWTSLAARGYDKVGLSEQEAVHVLPRDGAIARSGIRRLQAS
jgi:hypothetical protein